jgi:hypothetical protein
MSIIFFLVWRIDFQEKFDFSKSDIDLQISVSLHFLIPSSISLTFVLCSFRNAPMDCGVTNGKFRRQRKTSGTGVGYERVYCGLRDKDE